MAIIFMGKQFLLSVMEYYMPLFWKLVNLFKFGWEQSKENRDSESPQFMKDLKLVEWGQQGLFYEYLEMVSELLITCC